MKMFQTCIWPENSVLQVKVGHIWGKNINVEVGF